MCVENSFLVEVCALQRKPNKLKAAVRKLQAGALSKRRRSKSSKSQGPPPPAPPPQMQAGATKMDLGLYCSVISVATGVVDETENLFVIQGFQHLSAAEQRQSILLMYGYFARQIFLRVTGAVTFLHISLTHAAVAGGKREEKLVAKSRGQILSVA